MWRLAVTDWTGPARWRWRLSDPAGGPVAEHQVELDPDAWEFEAFGDLYRYLYWSVAPDQRREHEAALLADVGDWIGQRVLGPVAEAIGIRPATVRLELPAEAAVLGYRPWELARVGGRSWAESRVRVVVVPQPRRRLAKNRIGDRLRMLAVFSLPDGQGALNLRRERFALARLVRDIARVHGKAVELQVLQYGATRKRLADALLEHAGWDVVHLSGHGRAGGLVLEDDAGRPDEITSAELVDLLDLGGEQIKLVTLSACESAAVTATEHLRLLGLAPTRDGDPADEDPAVAGPQAAVLPAVATEVVDRLDCAVLAMRYPVGDEFAIGLAGSFYELLLGKEHPVAGALAASLVHAPDGRRPSGLSLGTPALFGERATDLTLVPPDGDPTAAINTGTGKLAGFPDQPDRFVGRVGALTRASQALAPESRCPGVVLHGMAGAGKTACALELAYTHQQSFRFMAWYRAPEEQPGGVEIAPALVAFALAIERQLPGLEWAHLVDNPDRLRDFQPQLTQVFEDNRILLVLDNVESLLTEAGKWRDDRWAGVLGALLGHRGLSRVVVTSRRLPVGLPEGVLVEAVHSLSAAESVLLARELPRLRGLIDGTDLPAGVSVEAGQGLVSRVLETVQGHPKLLELADGAAADPAELAERLTEVDAAWLARGTRLDGFLRGETSLVSDVDFGAVLAGWTRSAAAGLPEATGLLLRVVCGLEDADRQPNVLAVVWPKVWELAGHAGPAPDPDTGMALLAGRALAAAERDPGDAVSTWRVHPGVADAVRIDTDPELAAVVDEVAGDAWLGTLDAARGREAEQQREGAWVLRAARSAVPYLLRRHRWDDLDHAAQHVLARDGSVGAAAGLVPMLGAAVEATRDSGDSWLALNLGRTRARAVLRLDRAQGVVLLKGLLEAAITVGLYAHASVLAGDLVDCYRREGHLGAALELADRKIDYSGRAGFGPWTQLLDRARRLQVLNAQGRYREVLDGVERLRDEMARLPVRPDPAIERVDAWNVRETTLNTGMHAAHRLGWWEQALELNAEILTSLQGRGAGGHAQAASAFNDYGSLIRLGRVAEARELLIGCLDVFERVGDLPLLGKTLLALADVEDVLGHRARAVDLQRQALRFSYAAGDPDAVGTSHHNLANYLQRDEAAPEQVGAHRIAACLLGHRIGSGLLPGRLSALGRFLNAYPGRVPRSFLRVEELVGQVPGVDLAGLLARLPSHPDTGTDLDAALAAVLAAAPDAAAAEQMQQVQQALEQWEPVVSALHTSAAGPDPATRAAADTALTAVLDANSDGWPALVAALRRLHAGNRDPAVLLADLDDLDTAVARRALDVVTGTATVDPDAWQALVPPSESSADPDSDSKSNSGVDSDPDPTP